MTESSPTTVDGARIRWRAKVVSVCCVLTALMVKQAPGLVIADTKLDLTVDPWGFLGRALHLWDPGAYFGQVQNQAYGYFFPMGPFFGLGESLGVPPWVTQRAWLALLVCLAFTGVTRLAGLLGVRSEVARICAGLAFALTPRLLTGLGPTSVEILPMCLAPWVLVPLVAGSRGGDERRAAAWSALAVLGMGGVNAVATAAALPPAVLWLATRARGPRRTRLAAWWAAGVVLATTWWIVPLLLLGRYSPDFLSFIESAGVTTGPTSLVETLRGTSAWLAYVSGPYGPALPGGWSLLTNPVVILDTVVVAAFGLAALTWRGTAERRWMVLCLLTGVTLVTAGHVGAVSGPWAPEVRAALDGGLAPLRNLHKFDVVLRLPLVLAGAFLLERLLAVPRPGRNLVPRAGRGVVLLTATTALVGVSLPVTGFGLPSPGPYRAVPDYWRDAADWLGARDGTSLLVPGSSFGDYYWGSTRDEPMQALAAEPWVVRDAVPLTTAGGIRYLDAVSEALSEGQPSAGLAEYLSRAGVRYLVVRNDLEYGRAQSERPLLVHETLVSSPGIARVRAFGPVVGGGNAPGRYVDEGLDVPYRAVEVFAVAGWQRGASVAPLDGLLRVSGGPESLLDLAERGWLRRRPTVLLADADRLPAATPGTSVLTDGLRRREVFFGRLTDNRSATLARGDSFAGNGAAPDYLEPGWSGHLTVARPIGVRAVDATSSRSDAVAVGGARRDSSPWAAVDGDVDTAWSSDPGADGSASWRADLGRVRRLPVVRFLVAGSGAEPVDVRVRTDRGGVAVGAVRPGSWQVVRVPGGRTRHLTVTSRPSAALGTFSLAEVRIPGVDARRTLVVPGGTGDASWLAADTGYQRPDCFPLVDTWLCSRRLARGGEEGGAMDRTVRLAQGTYDVQLSATPRAGAVLDSWLDRALAARDDEAGPGRPEVTASSSAGTGPAGRPGAVVDGLSGTGWRAAEGDRQPWLRLRWSRPVTVDRLQLRRVAALAASYPARVEVVAGAHREVARVSPGGRVGLASPVTARQLTVRVTRVTLAGTYDPYTRDSDLLPVGVSELTWSGGPPGTSAAADRRLAVPCGAGPTVAAGGRVLPTEGSTTYRDVLSGRAVTFTPCGSPVGLALGGRSRIRADHSPTWDVAGLSIRPLGESDPGASGRPPVVVDARGSARGNDLTVPVAARAGSAVLWVRQSFNRGWQAELAGRDLRPVVVDGWQQGFVLPAGAAGEVEVRFGPDRAYRAGLLVGAVAVLVLLVLAVRPARRPTRRPPVLEGGLARVIAPLGALLLVALAGWWGLGVVAVVAAVAVAAAVVPGPRPGVRTWLLAGLAAAGVAAAGCAVALRPWPSEGYSAGAGWSQALCLLGLGTVWASTLRLSYIGTRLRSRETGRSRTT